MKYFQVLGDAIFKLGLIAIFPMLCVPLYHLIGFVFEEDAVPHSVLVRLGNTILEIPSEVVLEDLYFGKAWTDESRLDQNPSINIKLSIFEKARPSVINLYPFSNKDQLTYPEAIDAYLGNGRFSDRFVEFVENHGTWEVFSSISDRNDWYVFSQEPLGWDAVEDIPLVAHCYNASGGQAPKRLTCLSLIQLDGLGAQFNFDYDRFLELPNAKSKLSAIVAEYVLQP